MKKENFLPKFRKNPGLYSWTLYDFANTIFSAVVLTFYFPLYLTNLTQRNIHLGLSSTLSMILAGLAVPGWGALSDRTGKTKLYLIRTTLLCVICTLSLSLFTGAPLLIAGFLAACFFYHASLVFYHALLPVVAKPENQGFASGMGTGLGYLGTVFAIPLAHLVDSFLGRRFVFGVAGILFLLFSIPLFLWVPERRVKQTQPFSLNLFWRQWERVLETIKSLRQKPKLLSFLLGNFFVMEAMNTVIFWFVIYTARVFNPPPASLVAVFLGVNFSAFLAGFLAGFMTDRFGSEKTLLAAASALFVTLLTLGLSKNFWVFVTLSVAGGGFAFAGIWTAARKRVVELSPPGEIGEYFGIYNLTTKISVAGSLIFSMLADRFGFRSALLSLTIPAGVGVSLLWFSRIIRRSASRYPSS